jgi:hypothetical protein
VPTIDLSLDYPPVPPACLPVYLQYTSKMEGMLNDLATAETQAAEFRGHLAAKKVALPRGMEFSVQVLTTGFWPSFPKVRAAAQRLLLQRRRQRAAPTAACSCGGSFLRCRG